MLDDTSILSPAPTRPTIVLAAGGTGGHLFPAEGLAEVLMARGVRVVLITDKRFAHYATTGYKGALSEVELYVIRAGGLGGSLFRKIRGVFDMCAGVYQAKALLKKLQPAAVAGFGGYPSFPTMLAASRLGIPTLIHEQNALLGKANRMLASGVDKIALSYPVTGRLNSRYMAKSAVIGNPVRASIRALHDVPYSELTADGTLRILVTGGSQGASVFAKIVPAALAMLPEKLRTRIRVDQQCRAADIDSVRAAYTAIHMNADIAPFFADIPARLASAHLVIARAGASTVAELAVAGRPAILVPLPGAADDHQTINAQAFEKAGGGWLVKQPDFTAQNLAAQLESCFTQPAALSRAAKNARLSGNIGAAEALADLTFGLIGMESASTKKDHAA